MYTRKNNERIPQGFDTDIENSTSVFPNNIQRFNCSLRFWNDIWRKHRKCYMGSFYSWRLIIFQLHRWNSSVWRLKSVFLKIWSICFSWSNIAMEQADLLQQMRGSMNALFCVGGLTTEVVFLWLCLPKSPIGVLPLNPATAPGPWPDFFFFFFFFQILFLS